MSASLKVKVGQSSDAGVKNKNDDSCGIYIPEVPLLTTKGIVAVIADGMSSSEAGREAAEACVLGFLSDYFSTPESWSVKKSGGKVLSALNRWLYGQGQKLHGSCRGMVTTLSILVVKSTTAYLFHVGDTRIYRFRGNDFECLTRDHRALLSADKHHLTRAMGIELELAIDCCTIPVEKGDLFLLTTDGVHDYISPQELKEILKKIDDPELTVREIIGRALMNGSGDNLTCQMVRVDRLPLENKMDLYEKLTELPFPPSLEPGMSLDGYRVLRELHSSNRVQIYLACDIETAQEVVLKTPSVNFEDDPEYIERFLQEEWIGRRIHSSHVLKILPHHRPRSFLYYVTERIPGQTLRQWMVDHPRPALTQVRSIVEQIALGLYAFHRLEMFHQDLKPDNIMIDEHDTVKIIDFGSTKIAGLEEIAVPWSRNPGGGTLHYMAPECLKRIMSTEQSDLYSLGVITYEMLTGKLPFDETFLSSHKNQSVFIPVMIHNQNIPVWVNGAIQKAVEKDPKKRYENISKFIYDLSHPNAVFLSNFSKPLLDKNPVFFWKIFTVLLLIINLILLFLLVP